MADNRV